MAIRFVRLSLLAYVLLACIGLAPAQGAKVKTEKKGDAKTSAPAEVAAIFFPGYHRDMHYDSWFGWNWNEWDLLTTAPERFPGQHRLQPVWGPFDEADPKWMEKQIDTAWNHGIDIFIFDWYWYSGVKILNRPVDEGFQKARNRNKMKYALMWANHDWQDLFPAPYGSKPRMLLPQRHSPEDFERVMNDCIRLHFRQRNYWRVGGGCYFSFFQPELFIKEMGGPEKAHEVLDRARRQVNEAGLGSVHFAAFAWMPDNLAQLQAAGFDSLTSYNMCWSGKAGLPKQPFDEYGDVVQAHPGFWASMDTGKLPYMPVVTVGWNTTARWAYDTPFPPDSKEYPYSPVVVNNTPEKFGELCRMARKQFESGKLPAPAVLINAWNEWTEGSAILPEKKYGMGYLDQVLDVFHPERRKR